MYKPLTLILFFICVFTLGQKKTLTLEDATLGYWKGLYPESLQSLQWLNSGNSYMYVADNNLVFYDAETGKETKKYAFTDFQKAYPQLKGFPSMKEVSDGMFSFQNENSLVIYDFNTNDRFTLTYDEKAENVDVAPNSNNVAFTIENNLYVTNDKGSNLKVTEHSDKNIVSGQAIHRSEYGITKGTFWSPNSNFLAFYQKNEKDVTEYPLVDVTTYPATEMPIKYPMAGQESEIGAVGIYDVKQKKTTMLNIDTSDNHYLTNLSWTPDEKYILLAEINRATTHYDLNLYDISTGNKVRTIMSESNDRWVEPEKAAVFIPGSNTDFIWFSEKDGFMNLYQYTTTGKLKKQLTSFKWVVQDIIGFDEKVDHVFISGTGPDARETHTYKINLKNGKSTRLTTQPGSHHSMLSKNGKYLIDTYLSLIHI